MGEQAARTKADDGGAVGTASDAAVAGGVGIRLRLLRRERGLAQATVAEAVGISQSTLSGLERGDTAGRSLETLAALARFFGVSADSLLGLDGENLEKPTHRGLTPIESAHIERLRALSFERMQMVLRLAQLLHGDDVRWQRYNRLVTALEAEDATGLLDVHLERLFALARELGSVGAAITVLAREIRGEVDGPAAEDG
jgi:transcriptional regulator with XRE-family HTH domain